MSGAQERPLSKEKSMSDPKTKAEARALILALTAREPALVSRVRTAQWMGDWATASDFGATVAADREEVAHIEALIPTLPD